MIYSLLNNMRGKVETFAAEFNFVSSFNEDELATSILLDI